MSTRDTRERLVDSRSESADVRSLLEAGIDEEVGDYDYERGLSTHLAAIGPAPAGGGGAAPAGPAPAAQSAAGGMSAKGVALAIGLPVASLSAIAAVVLMRTAAPISHDAHGPAVAPVAVAEGTPMTSAPESATPSVEGNGTAAPAGVTRLSSNGERQMSAAAGRNIALPLSAQHTMGASVASRAEPDSHGGIVREFPSEPPAAAPVVASNAAPSAVRPSASAAEEAREAEAREREKIAREEARRAKDDQLQREMEELARAKRALSGDPRLALELAERGQREYKQSLLREEREHVLLLALIGMGRVSEAERRAQPYLTNHPDSPFARRVRAALDSAKSSKKR